MEMSTRLLDGMCLEAGKCSVSNYTKPTNGVAPHKIFDHPSVLYEVAGPDKLGSELFDPPGKSNSEGEFSETKFLAKIVEIFGMRVCHLLLLNEFFH